MSADSSARFLLLNEIADDVAERLRCGERPSLKEYQQRHPELAGDLAELFPALVQVAQVKDDCQAEAEPAAPRPPLALEQLGDYRIVRLIGQGGMGAVYEAIQLSLGRRVALKVLPPRLLDSERYRARFEREAKAAGRLHHTNIVPVYGVGEDNGTPYFAMQFIQGHGLDVVLDELRRLQKPAGAGRPGPDRQSGRQGSGEPLGRLARSLLTGEYGPADVQPLSEAATDLPAAGSGEAAPPPSAAGLSSSAVVLPGQSGVGTGSRAKRLNYWQSVAQIGMQVASALEYAHKQGVLHRDIKPSNLLLDLQGTVWITDFGLAKADDQQDLTATGDILGTLRYMSPECFGGKADRRGDVHALGLTLFELLALRPAYTAGERSLLLKEVMAGEVPRLEDQAPGVPRDLATVVHKALERDLADRYASAAALAEDLQHFLDDEPIKARRLGLAERLARWVRRNRAMAAALSGVALLLVVLTTASVLAASHFRRQADAQEKLAGEKDTLAKRMNEERETAVKARNEADAARKLVEISLYRAEMNLGAQAAPFPDAIGRIAELTGNWKHKRPDPRGWEWYALNGLCHRNVLALSGHHGRVFSLLWSPDGRAASVGEEDDAMRVWDVLTGKPVLSLPTRGFRRNGLAWSPDGGRLAYVGDEDRQVQILDVATGKTVLTVKGHFFGVRGLAWSPDGKRLASAAFDFLVRVWDAQTGALLCAMPTSQGHVEAVAWSSDSTVLVATHADGMVRRWRIPADFRPGALAALQINLGALVLRGAGLNETPPVLSPDGKRLAAGCNDSTVRLYDVASGKRTLLFGHLWYAGPVAWAPDSAWLASGGSDRTIRIWDPVSGREVRRLEGHSSDVLAVAWAPDGARLASAGNDQTIRVWSPATGKELFVLRGHTSAVNRLAWSPDGTRLISAGNDGGLRVWDVRPAVDGRPLEGGSGAAGGLAWSPDGRQLAVRRHNEVIRWGPSLEQPGRVLAGPCPAQENTGGWSACGKWLAAGTWTGAIPIWSARDGLLFRRLVQPGDVRALAWGPDGKWLATGGTGAAVWVWDVASGKVVHKLPMDCMVEALAWGPKRQLAGAGNHLRIWALTDGKFEQTADLANEGAVSLAWAPDGKRLACGGRDSHIHIRGPDGEELLALRGHTSQVGALAWAPDGKRLASGGNDSFVRIWGPDSPREILALRGHAGPITGLAWAPDGARLASCDITGRALIHDATPGYVRERSPALLPLLDRRLAAQPDAPGKRRRRALVLARLGKWDEAAVELRRCAERGSEESSALVVAGWWVAGPFARRQDEPGATASPFDKGPDGSPIWLPARPSDDGALALGSDFPAGQRGSAYALLRVWSSSEQRALAVLHAAGPVRAWLNGKLVPALAGKHAPSEQDAVPAPLPAGWSTLLLRAERGEGPAPVRLWLSSEAERALEEAGAIVARGRWNEAETALLAAVKRRPQEAALLHRGAGRAFLTHARTLEKMGQEERGEQARRRARAWYERVVAARPEDEAAAGELAAVLRGGEGGWTVLRPDKATSSDGATLTVLADGSIQVTGHTPPHDTYTVEAVTKGRGTAVRLEALASPGLANGGPGRNTPGNFALSEVTLKAESAGGGGPQPVELSRAVTDYIRLYNLLGSKALIDGKQDTCWDVWHQLGRSHSAWIEMARPVGGRGPTRLSFQLDCRSHHHHGLGLFRLSVSGAAAPLWGLLGEQIGSEEPGKGWVELGAALAARGEWGPALAALRKASRLPGGSGTADLLIALVQGRTGQDRAEGAAAIAKWLAVQPGGQAANELAHELALEALPREGKGPVDVRLVVARATLLAKREQWKEALAELRRAQALAPERWALLVNGSTPLLDVCLSDAVRREDWQTATVAQDRWQELDRSDVRRWYRGAILLAWAGDRAGYQRVRAWQLSALRDMYNASNAQRVAITMMLAPPSRAELDAARELAQRAVEMAPEPRSWVALGLVEYRAGKWDEAERSSRKVFERTTGDLEEVCARLVLAMTLHRTNRTKEARVELDRACKRAEVGLAKAREDANNWQTWLLAKVLRREAEALIGVVKEPKR